MPRTVLSLIAFTVFLPASAAAGRSAVAAPSALQAPPPLEAGAPTDSLIEALLRVAHERGKLAQQRFPESADARADLAEATSADLARMDSVFFDALFAQCDAETAIALLTDDVEFYDDRTGLSVGPDLHEDFRRLAENCPADNGVRRMLLPRSVDVSPIAGYGAVQTGVHHFVETGASTSTVAEFVHVWRRAGDAWRLARIISVHETVDAARAAELRVGAAAPLKARPAPPAPRG